MLSRFAWYALIAFAWMSNGAAAGDAARGASAFGQCAACHSTAPGMHMTGPSLAHVWARKAGTADGFHRYSDALTSSGISWNAQSLDKWLANPATFIPNNGMVFPGIRNSAVREDIIAYLKAMSEGRTPTSPEQGRGMMGGGGPRKMNLKSAPAEGQVTSLEHCHDTYTVKTADGKTNKVWEFNLRLKIDSSADGPLPEKPVIIGAGMRSDRASVVFSSPAEISRFIKESCK